MNARLASAVLLLLGLAFSGFGCKSDDKPGNGGPGTSTGGPSDSGVDSGAASLADAAASDDEDAGPVSADTLACRRVDVVQALDEDLTFDQRASGVTDPLDLMVTRQVARWAGTCDAPQIVVKLSSGRCPDGDGHELDFTIAKHALEDGTFVIGENILQPETTQQAIKIRYVRPDNLPETDAGVGGGTWGSCPGMTGQIVLRKLPKFTARSKLAVRFVLTLAACDGSKNEPVAVTGSFNIELPAITASCAQPDAGQ